MEPYGSNKCSRENVWNKFKDYHSDGMQTGWLDSDFLNVQSKESIFRNEKWFRFRGCMWLYCIACFCLKVEILSRDSISGTGDDAHAHPGILQ